MSLVAYGSSDESENEDQEIAPPQSTPKFDTKQVNKEDLQNESAPQPVMKINNVQNVNNDDFKKEVDSSARDKGFISTLEPQKSNVTSQDGLKAKDSSSKKTAVKISVPSLSEFKDDESEPTKKKLKPSAKGSGLFALLPAPRNVFLKETKSSDGTKTQAPLVPRALSKPPVKPPPMIPKRFLKPDEDSIPEESNEGPLDFFSLSSLDDVPDNAPSDSFEDLSGSSLNLPPPRSWGNSTSDPQKDGASSSDPQTATADDDFIPVDNSNVQLSEEALQALCGRRATRQQQEVEIIDVSGAALLPDPNEWLTKQLTEERQLPSRGFGRRHDGPTSQQRRKHQITYLAFQAKENELELKNQWSQNRMSRKQTQSKYGF